MIQYTEIADQRIIPAPRVSIVVLAYRHEDCLERAVQSLVNQRTNVPYEIIIAEDSSPDRTLEVARRLQRQHYSLVRVITTAENKGANRNLRLALEQARGAYIALCEGDDFWTDPMKLDRQVASLETNLNVDLAISRGQLIFSDGTTEEGWDYGSVPRILSPTELFSGFGWIAPSASLMWRRNVTDPLPEWWDEAPIGDLLLLIAGSVRGGVFYDPASTIGYQVGHPSSFTARLSQENLKGQIDRLRHTHHAVSTAVCYYKLERSVITHRLDDMKLKLARARGRRGEYWGALKELGKLSLPFVVHGLARRLKRVLTKP